jgi:thiamine-phosphate pyrophosphorylase
MNETKTRPQPRLMLFTPWLGEGTAEAVDLLALACGAGDIAAVIARFSTAPEDDLAARIRALLPSAQDKGTALLLQDRAALAIKLGADGAHLLGSQALREGIALLKPGLIAGAGGLATRHDAMRAGEAGADYVMFGEPDTAGKRPSFSAVVERVAWWAEIFEVPCVGYAGSLDEVPPLIAAGADFIALADTVWTERRTVAAVIAGALSRIRMPVPVAQPARS